MTEPGVLVCFGMGFTGTTLGRRLAAKGWRIFGTARSENKCEALQAEGYDALLFDGVEPGLGIAEALREATHVLNSVPPGAGGDPVLIHHGGDIAACANLQWVGILSTIGVYGEHHGGWVDEDTPVAPVTARSRLRAGAEADWQNWGDAHGIGPRIFRLPGIYGPGRNQLVSVKKGKARRLVKPGQVFNRVHVDDIASALETSMLKPSAGPVFNVSDDLPAPPQDVVAYACELMGVALPPEVDFETAVLSPMARSFYGECKRVRNDRMKQALGIELAYPTYREGLSALWEQMSQIEDDSI